MFVFGFKQVWMELGMKRMTCKRWRFQYCRNSGKWTSYYLIGAVLLAVVVRLPTASAYSTINMATFTTSAATGMTISGSTANGYAGSSVSDAGDVNGDRLSDIIIGVPNGFQNGLTEVGQAFVIFGKTPAAGYSNILLGSFTSGTNGFKIRGEGGGNLFGTSVSGAGDVNNDGYGDIIVGAPQANTPTTAGKAYIIFGHSMATAFADIILSAWPWGTQGFIIVGGATTFEMGFSVSNAGDVNGDGFDDVIAGSPSASHNGQSQNGVAVVIFGHRNTTTFSDINMAVFSSGSTGFIISGRASGEKAGSAVAAAGDVNGDGFDDVIVGAPLATLSSRTNCGVAYVIFGHGNVIPFVTRDMALITNFGYQIIGKALGDLLGTAVSGAGDVNNDGFDDVVVGAYMADAQGRSNAGSVYVIYGHANTTTFNEYDGFGFTSIPSIGFELAGVAVNDEFGYAVSGAGDINGDGKDDIIVGAHSADPNTLTNAGTSYIIFGGLTAFKDMNSFASGAEGFIVQGAGAGAKSGHSVSGAGDFNGDGVIDVLVGAYQGTPPSGSSLEGQAYLLISPGSPSRAPTSQPSSQPSRQPSRQPTGQPTRQPSRQPTSQPTRVPSCQPSRQPSSQPSTQSIGVPSGQPSVQPTGQPSVQPSTQPSFQPTSQPSAYPSAQPSEQPTRQPSAQPSAAPTTQPSAQPSAQPSHLPSHAPSAQPTSQPSLQPSTQPSRQPSAAPSRQPSVQPTAQPSLQPSAQPSAQPFAQPSTQPSRAPSRQPSGQPSAQPKSRPSAQPSVQPSVQPTGQPSTSPSCQPSVQPSAQPSWQPSSQPSRQPTGQPSVAPYAQPTSSPTGQPTICPSSQPSAAPSTQPSGVPSDQPSGIPSSQPSEQPSASPSQQPSGHPTGQPTSLPSAQPSARPSCQPSGRPSGQLSAGPSSQPSSRPSVQPTATPSAQPTCEPSSLPTNQPSGLPSAVPTAQPSDQPTSGPSVSPSSAPSSQPSSVPSSAPTSQPSSAPSNQPSCRPSGRPSALPSVQPSCSPSAQPFTVPSAQPSARPTATPSSIPSADPSSSPSGQPSSAPSGQPTDTPTGQPSLQPVAEPSAAPTSQPTASPTVVPSTSPSASPSAQPTAAPTSQPSSTPTAQPRSHPSSQPSAQPSSLPSSRPTRQPMAEPTGQPTAQPFAYPSYGAFFNVSVKAVATGRSWIQLEVMITGMTDAYVHCAAFLGGNYRLSTTRSLLTGSGGSLVAEYEPVGINITGLVPFTAYVTYCTAVSLRDLELSWENVLRTRQTARTQCCRELRVEVLAPSIFVGVAAARPLSLAADALPSASLTLTLGSTSGLLSFHPTQLVVRNTSNLADLSQSLFLVATAATATDVTVTLSGPSAAEYTVMYIGSSSVRAIATTDEPAVPAVRSAVFSDDGSFVTVAIDASTDRGGFTNGFPCSTLLAFPGDASATCLWSGDAIITVYPRTVMREPTINVSSVITLVGGKLRAKCPDTVTTVPCSDWDTVVATQTRVLAPTSPVQPSVVLVAPSTLDACASLTLDLSGSVGAAGRPWSSVTFQVLTGSGAMAAALQLERYLQRNYTISPPTSVPQAVLAKDMTYRVQVTLCNFLGACGSAVQSVSISASLQFTPVVSILGPTSRTALRRDILVVNAEAFTQACDGTKSYSSLLFQWSVTVRQPGESTFQAAPSLRSTSQNPAVFKLPAYTLTVGAEYQVSLSVTSTVSMQSSTASVNVLVAQGELVVLMAGGSLEYAAVGSAFTLDASGSYDQDYPALSGPSAQLQFSWSCVQTAPSFSAACPLTLSPSGYGQAGSVVTASSVDKSALVTITVSSGSRSRSTQVAVVIVPTARSKLFITNNPSQLVYVDTGKPLALLGSLSLLTPCTASWSVDDSSILLPQAARTLVSQDLEPSSSGAVPFNLVVTAGLLPQRATLLFSLSCGDVITSVTVTTNGAPLPGEFSVTPTVGNELDTVFTYSASQWSDPDLPLMYEFGFLSATSLANLVIVTKSELAYTVSTLPAGTAQTDYTVGTVVSVFDSLGSSAMAQGSAVVYPVSAIQKDASLTRLLLSSSGSVDATKQILAIVSTALNSVNCSAALDCAGKNRGPCVKTAGQCSTCLAGFVGDRGDRNTLCMPVYALVNVTANGTICAQDSDCLHWQECNVTAGQCVNLPKGCGRNCSSHGTCLFIDRVYGRRRPSCQLSDLQCDAVCSCEGGYSGEFCEIDSSTLQRQREIRSNLIGSLSNLTRLEDVNPESVASWSASLYSLSLRPHDLSVNDVRAVTAIANTTLANALSLGVQRYQGIVGVLQATDAVASLLKYNYNPNDYDDPQFTVVRGFLNNTAAQVIPVVRSFGDLVSGAQVLGEPRTDLLYDNFRLTAAVSFAEAPLTAAQSTVEKSVGDEATVIAFDAAPGAEQRAISTTLVVMDPRAYGESSVKFISTPVAVRVQESREAVVVDLNHQLLSGIEFTFQHNDPQDQYVHYESANLTTTCTERNASQQFSFMCLDSGHVIRHNCSRGAGVQTSYCPRPASACARLDYVSADISLPTTCRVFSYNATYTTCRCNVTDVPSGSVRRLAAREAGQEILDDSGASNMVVSTVFIASNFADTFDSADELNSPGAVARVIVVIAMLGALWVPALLFMGYDGVKPVAAKAAKDAKSALDAKARFLRYVRTIIPSVYATDMSLTARLWDEIAQHHTLFSLLTSSSAHKRRETICKMLTVLTFMLFLTAVFFDVSNPGDDGSCVNHTVQDDCLHRVSPFDGDRTFCQWTADSTCEYNTESMSMKALFYLTVLTTVLTSIATVPIDYCFQILSAPTAQSLKGSTVMNAVTAMVDGARRFSNVGINVARRMTAVVRPAATAISSERKLPRTVFGLVFGSSEATIIANRELSEEFQECSEEVRLELPAIAAAAGQSALRDEVLRDQRRAKSARRIAARSTTDAAVQSGAVREAEAVSVTRPTLLSDIILQRLQMNDLAEETVVFDAQWGIRRKGWEGQMCYITPVAEQAIVADLETAEEEAMKLSEALPNYSVHHAGLEILHLFMVDLLGRNTMAAKIFKEKFGEEFGDSQVVLMAQKYAAAALLVGLNAFFMYFILLKGVQKGQHWQLQYLVCAVFQIAVDVLVFETTECIWLNFTVPRAVDVEVVTAAATLTALAEKAVVPGADASKKTSYFLNAAAQLFVSMRLAKAHPQLLESLIVMSYTNHLPGQICKTWPHYQLAEELREVAVTKSLFPRSLLRGLALAAQVCLTIPYVYQRVILRFVQPVIFSAISVVWFVAIQSTASIIALCAACAAGIGYWLWRRYQSRRAALQRQASILPVATAVAIVSGVAPATPLRTFVDGYEGVGDDVVPETGHNSDRAGSPDSWSDSLVFDPRSKAATIEHEPDKYSGVASSYSWARANSEDSDGDVSVPSSQWSFQVDSTVAGDHADGEPGDEDESFAGRGGRASESDNGGGQCALSSPLTPPRADDYSGSEWEVSDEEGDGSVFGDDAGFFDDLQRSEDSEGQKSDN